MEKDYSFLHLLINETLYLVDKPNLQSDNDITNSEKQINAPLKTVQPTVVISSDATDKVLFLILENEFFSPQERELLVKLVETTNIPFSQVQRIVLANYKPFHVPYSHYFMVFTRQKPAFLLGEKYSVFEKDNKKMVWSAPLTELLADKQQKVLLWGAMKKMFDL
jgi:hypothetical protein